MVIARCLHLQNPSPVMTGTTNEFVKGTPRECYQPNSSGPSHVRAQAETENKYLGENEWDSEHQPQGQKYFKPIFIQGFFDWLCQSKIYFKSEAAVAFLETIQRR